MIRDLPFVIPEHGTTREVEVMFGLPPPITRLLIKKRLIRSVRVYQRELVDLASLRAYLASLPPTVIAPEEGGSRHGERGTPVPALP